MNALSSFDTLRIRLLLFTALPLLLLLVGSGITVLRGLEVRLDEQLRDEVQLVARAIRLPLSHALERGREGSLEQAIDSAFRINRIYGAYVYDEHGTLVAGTGAREPRVASDRLVRIAEGGQRREEFDTDRDEAIYSYFVPLTDSGGRISGLLQLTRQGRDFDTYLLRLRWQGLAVLSIAGALLAAVLTFGYRRAVGDPLRSVLVRMARIKAGHRGERVPVSGPSEMRRLASGINGMLDSISASDTEIARQREEQVELERRLRHSEKLAAIGQLGAGVAHELGSPLSVVSGEVQRLKRNGHGGKSLERMGGAVLRMQHIVAQLLDFSRNNPVQVQQAAPEGIAQSALAAVREEARQASVGLEWHGPRTPPRPLTVDPLRIEQALVNLLRNAIQAAPDGQVRLAWFQEDGRVGFLVEDSGPGVAEHLRERIVEPFFTTKRVGQGTGLGLAVVHGIVAEHGATLEIGISPAGGASFRIELPGAAEGRGSDDSRG